MKKIILATLAIVLGLVSCVKNEQYPGVTISNVKYSPETVTDQKPVTVSATITSFTEVTANLIYKIGEKEETVAMTAAEGSMYYAEIPVQQVDTKVSFYISAKNANMSNTSATMEYTVGALVIDYTTLRLNELNGNDKFIEIYNSGAEEINLKNVYIQKDEVTNWTADETIVIPANGFVLLYSVDVAGEHPEIGNNYIFDSGLSAKKNVRVQLFTPSGTSIDDFNLTNIDANAPEMIPAPASYSRNADGQWYYAEATPGEVNVDGETPLQGLEGGEPTPPGPTPPTPEEPDYTNLVLNELNGDTKFIEFYNMGDVEIKMEGMYLCKDGAEGVEYSTWIGDATVIVPAHGYVLLYSEDVVAAGAAQEGYPENLVFHSGLSAKKTLKYALYMPDGTERDVFTRGETGEWGQTISNQAPNSYARTPDGGDWKLAEPTPGGANPETGDEIPQV